VENVLWRQQLIAIKTQVPKTDPVNNFFGCQTIEKNVLSNKNAGAGFL
jgi:hypothetical protein